MEGGSRTPHEPHDAEGLHPQYIYTLRVAGRLAIGELAVEPVLGPARVTAVRPAEHAHTNEPRVQVGWRDEHGPGEATGLYPAGQTFEVCMPSLDDRRLVRRGIDQAVWHQREISDNTARLIAAHIHPGAPSALHRFMVEGSISERVYDELEHAARHRQYARQWIDALARYCLARQDTGPIAAWTRRATAEAEARVDQLLASARVILDDLAHHGDNSDRNTHRAGLLAREQMPTEMATRLIDAAFLLGVSAARRRDLPAAVRQRLSGR